MLRGWRQHGLWIAAWCLAAALGAVALARLELALLREAFETDARIAHRLLSQRMVQHDAVLATLALLQPTGDDQAEQRLPSLYPQILKVQRRERDAGWPDTRQASAEAQSRALRRPALAWLDLAQGRYQLVQAADPASFALTMDLGAAVPWSEWPMAADTSPVRVALEHAGQRYRLQAGRVEPGGWQFEFRKHLASDSQPFDVVATRSVGWRELPWIWMLGWALLTGALLAAARAWRGQRAARQRAEELLRLGQVARLNAMGELAAGMAHEINQPLTAVLANTQAAGRLLADNPPELDTARQAMAQAAEQARRASDVVGRLRRAVERPALDAALRPIVLQDAVRNALYLLEPECARRGVAPQVQAPAAAVTVLADPVALEQIVHNLLMNALQALDGVPAPERQLVLAIAAHDARGELRVTDSGPGIAPQVLARLFEPFFSTREGGLGLGLSLCETLATTMGGRLRAEHHTPRGAAFILDLPLAPP